MTLIDPQEYREAFVQYLRKGTPIRFETKNTSLPPITSGERAATARFGHHMPNARARFFHGTIHQKAGTLGNVEGSFDFYLRDEFADPADIGVEVIDPGETIFENIHRPLDNYLRGRTGLPPRGPQRLGVQTGESFSITDDWSGTLSGQIYLDPARSAYG